MNTINDLITDFIIERMSKKEFNNLKFKDSFAFSSPLVGFANADDSLFDFYKKHIGEEFYLLPEEWLELKFGRKFDKSNVSVVSYLLPQTEKTKSLCRDKSDCPAYEWQLSRVYGEECNRALASSLAEYLNFHGFSAVAPMCESNFVWKESERFYLASNWSERHTAHICGLGTFGLCDGLITEKGKAVRFGSVIFEGKAEATERPYKEYNEYCLARYGCRACIKRCPAEAITEKGHDKVKCMQYHREAIKPICKERYNYEGYSVCGLCQTGVPCESGIPIKYCKDV